MSRRAGVNRGHNGKVFGGGHKGAEEKVSESREPKCEFSETAAWRRILNTDMGQVWVATG